MSKKTSRITHAEVRMYRMGTGDCFVIKFFAGDTARFKMMIDCGTWQGKKQHLAPYVAHLKEYVEDEIDLLVVTHEHKDHVYGFEACKDLFLENLTIKQVWMGWTEDEHSQAGSQWLKDYGDKKKALAVAVNRINKAVKDPEVLAQFSMDNDKKSISSARAFFAGAMSSFADLQFAADGGSYVGMLKGMRILKEDIAKDNIRYCLPGEIINDLEKAEGIKFYVLGPPLEWTAVKKESGGKGESYTHNNKLSQSDAFAAAMLGGGNDPQQLLPFDMKYVVRPGQESNVLSGIYHDADHSWRKIDHDWLNSAGSLALRVNSMTNNLSLALAIEFEDSGRVMLFPGDAEYGSWASWHQIPWDQKSTQKDMGLTQDLLRRTVFYKVAHHLSHNGTAQRLGMEMMEHPDLAAMATLDYQIISEGWKGTMPNQPLMKELLKRTKGRLMVMKEDGLLSDRQKKITLTEEIKKARRRMNKEEQGNFTAAFDNANPLYLQYTVKAGQV